MSTHTQVALLLWYCACLGTPIALNLWTNRPSRISEPSDTDHERNPA